MCVVLCVCVCLSCSFAYEYACCRAKNALLEVGGTEDEFARIKNDAQQNMIHDALSACMNKEFEDAGVSKDDQPTEEQVDTAFANCEVYVREVYEDTGGDSDNFYMDKWRAAEDKVASTMKICLANQPDNNKNLTHCKEKARKDFASSGFTSEDFSVVRHPWNFSRI